VSNILVPLINLWEKDVGYFALLGVNMGIDWKRPNLKSLLLLEKIYYWKRCRNAIPCILFDLEKFIFRGIKNLPWYPSRSGSNAGQWFAYLYL